MRARTLVCLKDCSDLRVCVCVCVSDPSVQEVLKFLFCCSFDHCFSLSLIHAEAITTQRPFRHRHVRSVNVNSDMFLFSKGPDSIPLAPICFPCVLYLR